MQPPAAVALALLLQAPGQAPSAPVAQSVCPIAGDDTYAFTREHPVQVGGGAMYVAARERRYLDALRGPAGQVLRYRRAASVAGPDERTILDRYDVTYDGLDKPTELYLDAYHYDDELRAPRGFTCAVPIGLQPPGPDALLAMEELVGLALEQGGARDFAPISLDSDGSARHGVILDQFRMIARAARHEALAGHALDPKTLGALRRPRTIVIAFPLDCDGRSVPAAAVDFVAAQGNAPRRDGEYVTGEALARLLPELNVPAGSIASAYTLERPRPSDVVRIVYSEGACGAGEMTLPLTITPAKPLDTPAPAVPADQAPTDRPVRLQGLIDFDGVARRIVYIGGPAALTQPAIDAVRRWTAEPARINGAPVVTPVTLQVKFDRK